MSSCSEASSPEPLTKDSQEAVARRRPWTAEEDEILKTMVERYGSQRGSSSSWSQISSHLEGRTNKHCRKRWFHSLDPELKRGKWSKEEDAKLRQLHAELGPQWKEIALQIPGRKDDQVSKRWRDVIDPELTPGKPWEPIEDALLLQMYEQNGPKWSLIAEMLPGRSPIAVRNRSRRYHLNRNNDQTTSPSTAPLASTSSAGRPTPHDLAAVDMNDLMMNYEPVGPSGTGLITTPTGPDTPDFFTKWLNGVAGTNSPSMSQETQQLDLPGPSTQLGTVAHAPVDNAWSLYTALNTGAPAVYVSTNFLRQLLADASAGLLAAASRHSGPSPQS